MAKSFFEPKKVVRYANNQEIIEGGLGSAPTPRRVPTATRPVPKTQAIPAEAQKVSAPAPSPAPPDKAPTPPAPPIAEGETRSFYFDGATELTGSIAPASDKDGRTIKLTVHPAWSSDVTGSWALVTLGTSGSRDYREEYKLERVPNYGPLSNNYGTYTTAALTTADSASVNYEEGVDAADYTEVTTGWYSSYNSASLQSFKLFNRNSPFQEVSSGTRKYTRVEGNDLIFVVKNTALTGVTDFKKQILIKAFEKTVSVLTCEIISGSSYYKSTRQLKDFEPVASGSALYLEFNRYGGLLSQVKCNGKSYNTGGVKRKYPLPITRNLTSDDVISIGGLVSGSSNFFSGSIDQVAIYGKRKGLSNKTSAGDYSGDGSLQMYYTFEGTTDATTGNDLVVSGTETYVSSSI